MKIAILTLNPADNYGDIAGMGTANHAGTNGAQGDRNSTSKAQTEDVALESPTEFRKANSQKPIRKTYAFIQGKEME